MKKLFYIVKAGLVATCLGVFAGQADATTFTAVASGNFSSAATWGGAAPPQMVSTDVIVIPSNLTVTLDQSVTFNGLLASLVVNGTLSSAQNEDIVLQLGTFSGSGTINVDSMSLGLSSGFGFTGTINADKFTSIGVNMSSSANVNISGSLYLASGILNLAAGNVMMAANSTVIVSGGSLMQSGGALNLTNAYSVKYMGSSNTTAGFELSGAGLKDIDISVVQGASVMLSSDLEINGMLMLHSGMLDLNGNDLTFMADGDLMASGGGMITSSSASSIVINATNGLAGTLMFSTGGNTMNNLTINLGNSGSDVMLGGDIVVDGTLSLQSGRLDAGMYDVMLSSGASISGGSATSYVVTGVGGSLTMQLAAGNTNMYAVGTAAGYAPASVMANSGAATGYVSVGVNPDVYVNGMSGATLSSDQPLVNHTWYVSSTATANIDLNLEVMWNANAEINGFNRNTAYISHYTNGAWDASAVASASTTTNGMYKLSRNNVTSLSPFAVMDESAVVTGVNDIPVTNILEIYPNPVADVAVFSIGRDADITISDLAGRVMTTLHLVAGKNEVAVDNLPAGIYAVRVYGDGYIYKTKLVKQ